VNNRQKALSILTAPRPCSSSQVIGLRGRFFCQIVMIWRRQISTNCVEHRIFAASHFIPFFDAIITINLPSVRWPCWLGVRKSVRPVKIKRWGVGVVVCSQVQIVCIWSSWCHCIPKPSHLLPHLNPDWFYLSGTSLPRLSWKRGR